MIYCSHARSIICINARITPKHNSSTIPCLFLILWRLSNCLRSHTRSPLGRIFQQQLKHYTFFPFDRNFRLNFDSIWKWYKCDLNATSKVRCESVNEAKKRTMSKPYTWPLYELEHLLTISLRRGDRQWWKQSTELHAHHPLHSTCVRNAFATEIHTSQASAFTKSTTHEYCEWCAVAGGASIISLSAFASLCSSNKSVSHH